MNELQVLSIITGLIGGPLLAIYMARRQFHKEEEARRVLLATENLDRANQAFNMYTNLVEDLEKRIQNMDNAQRLDRDENERRKVEWERERAQLLGRIRDLEREIFKLKAVLRKEGVALIDE